MATVATGQLTLTDLNDNKQLAMYIGASQSRTVIFNGVSTYTPNYGSTNQILTPQLYVAGTNTDVASQAISVKWYVQTNGSGTPTEITTANVGTNYTLGTTMPYTLTIKANVLASNTTMTYICEIVYPDSATGFNVTTKAEIEIVRVTNGTNGSDGINALVAVLSNESDTIPTDSAGANGNYTGTGTDIYVYEGATALAYDGTGTANGTWKVTTAVSGVTAGAITDSGVYATMANVSAISADSASVTFTITGKTLNGASFTLTKKQTFSRAKAGTNGTTPTLYRLIPSANAIQQNISNVYNPTTLTVTGKSQTGTGTYGDYAGKFVIAESTDGTNFTDKYTSSGNEASKVYTPSVNNLKAIRVRIYLAGSTPSATNFLDEQIIPIVKDGATGASAVYAYVWTPDGNTVKNSTGSIKATVDVYSGSTEVTATAFKWYIQDPTATSASGGDTDSGNGWRLLTSTYNAGVTNYTTDTITIPATAVEGTESFLCVATYNSVKYKGVTTVVDLSDPIMVRLDGANIFKNGEGSVTIRATVLQAGAEIDSAGTAYTYTWSVYGADNVKTAFTKTGKTITVNATDVDGIANLVCEISK